MALPVMPEISQALRDIAEDYVIMKCRYQSALREVRTKLEILDRIADGEDGFDIIDEYGLEPDYLEDLICW